MSCVHVSLLSLFPLFSPFLISLSLPPFVIFVNVAANPRLGEAALRQVGTSAAVVDRLVEMLSWTVRRARRVQAHQQEAEHAPRRRLPRLHRVGVVAALHRRRGVQPPRPTHHQEAGARPRQLQQDWLRDVFDRWMHMLSRKKPSSITIEFSRGNY